MKNANFNKICLLPSAISELFAEVPEKGKITITDRYGLKAALLNNTLSKDEEDSINRLLHSVRQGRLKIVDEL
ncbi:MAG: hypothetical protein M3O33_07360 [Cyanobacteriota bacterium]|jgi:hypothetical protein|nr:hypothetical protein [Cyanobacteriota bacterium]